MIVAAGAGGGGSSGIGNAGVGPGLLMLRERLIGRRWMGDLQRLNLLGGGGGGKEESVMGLLHGFGANAS